MPWLGRTMSPGKRKSGRPGRLGQRAPRRRHRGAGARPRPGAGRRGGSHSGRDHGLAAPPRPACRYRRTATACGRVSGRASPGRASRRRSVL